MSNLIKKSKPGKEVKPAKVPASRVLTKSTKESKKVKSGNVPARFEKAVAVQATPMARPLVLSKTVQPGAGKIALGNPNKVGAGIERLNHVKNMVPATGVADSSQSKAVKLIRKHMKPDEVLSPDAKRYCDLLDAPFFAPWGDEGELQVKPLLYPDIVPPSTTTTCRQYGQQNVSIAGLKTLWVVLCAGAGNQQDLQVIDSDTTRYAAPCVSDNAGVPNGLCWTPGAPKDQRVFTPGAAAITTGGQGCAGYYYAGTSADTPPSVDVSTGGFVSASNLAVTGAKFSQANLLTWGSPAPFGEMNSDESSAYKFRPIAGGLMVTPTTTELNVGGEFNVSCIPQATNSTYVGPPVVPANGTGTAADVQEFYALPDHVIHRADGSVDAAWLPSRQDYDFLQTHAMSAPALGSFTPTALVTTQVSNARLFVQIINTSTETMSFTLTYIAFYEVAGRCIQSSGVVPRPQPSVGAKIATSVQNNLNHELETRTAQTSKGACLEIMKDHPKIGPLIETAETPKQADSILDNILSVGKTLLPFAAMLL